MHLLAPYEKNVTLGDHHQLALVAAGVVGLAYHLTEFRALHPFHL